MQEYINDFTTRKNIQSTANSIQRFGLFSEPNIYLF